MAEPAIRRASIALADYPAEAKPLRLALISDIHVSGPDMPPERLDRIVAQISALKPDLVLIAGDLVSEKRLSTRHYSPAEAVAPLAALDAPLGAVVVPGNHDHWMDWPAIRDEVRGNSIRVLANEAARIGPLVIGGLDDDFTGRADIEKTIGAMDRLKGAKVVLTHSPDVFPDLPGGIGLTLAGHTHCGQIRYPWGGTPATMSDYGDRYACGKVREGGKTLITGAGLGTSVAPFRFGTRAEIWLVEVRGQ